MINSCPGCQFYLTPIVTELNAKLKKDPKLDKEKFIESKMPDTGGYICCRVNILTSVRVTESIHDRYNKL